jgi:uncharacterized protein YciI
MSNSAFQFVPEDLLPKLASIKPYILLILTKGENYGISDTPRIIQSEHLPYVFKQRENGIMLLTMPVMDDTNITAVAVYNTTDKEEVRKLVAKDPAIEAGIFNYEIVTALGLPGDTLS